MIKNQIVARPFSNYKTLINIKKNIQLKTNLLFFPLGRDALIYGLKSLNIKPNASVILPSFICNSFIFPLESAGYNLIFIDVDEDMNMDSDKISELLKKNTDIEAILVVHYFGFFSNINDIVPLCKTFKVKVIEDCAHSFLSSHNNIDFGSFGDISIFSMRKTLPVSDGGALVINQKSKIKLFSYYRSYISVRDTLYIISRKIEFIVASIGFPKIYSNSFNKFKNYLRSKSTNQKPAYNTIKPIEPSFLLFQYLNDKAYLIETKNKIRQNYNLILDGAIKLGYKPLNIDLEEGIVPQWVIVYSYKYNMVEWLRGKGIGAMRWPWLEIPEEVKKDIKKYPMANYFNKNLVLIPVNQSMTPKECNSIIKLLKIWRKN
tara:strand:- start:502 stop:1626 length:1125 start_codon:yes stop_codon:yes gene_type:complete